MKMYLGERGTCNVSGATVLFVEQKMWIKLEGFRIIALIAYLTDFLEVF